MSELERAIFGALLGDKKVAVIEFIAKNVDKNGFINFTIDEIAKRLNISKPTAITTFKILQNAGVLKRIKNGVYEIVCQNN